MIGSWSFSGRDTSSSDADPESLERTLPSVLGHGKTIERLLMPQDLVQCANRVQRDVALQSRLSLRSETYQCFPGTVTGWSNYIKSDGEVPTFSEE